VSYRTLEVELEDGRVRPRGSETLPTRAHGLLTLLDSSGASAALTCGDLADRWGHLEKLSVAEAHAFADDLERARTNLPALKPSWD
jgi:hypothetical protein